MATVEEILAIGNEVQFIQTGCIRKSTVPLGYFGIVASWGPEPAPGITYHVKFEDGREAFGNFLLLRYKGAPSRNNEPRDFGVQVPDLPFIEAPEVASEGVGFAQPTCYWCGHLGTLFVNRTDTCSGCEVTGKQHEKLQELWVERLDAGTHNCPEERAALLRWAQANGVLKPKRVCCQCGGNENLTRTASGSYACYSCIAQANGWQGPAAQQQPTVPTGTPSWPSHSAGPSWED